jgi:hypothetical protein
MAEKTGRTHETRDRRSKPQPQNDEEGRGNGDGTPFGELTRAADEAAGATQRSMDRFEHALGMFWEEAGRETYGPIMRNVARANLELIGWMGRRARAAAEMPRQLVRCETPQDLLSEQGRFLQEMMRDFTGTTTRLLSMWTGDMPGERSRSARD